METQDPASALTQKRKDHPHVEFSDGALICSAPFFSDGQKLMLLDAFHAAVAAEREACANIAADYANRAFSGEHGSDVAGVAADHIASAIRARAG